MSKETKDHNEYYSTFIAVASDSKADVSKQPKPRGKKPTVAMLQYAMLADNDFVYTQKDVLFNVWLQRQELGALADDEVAALRETFFAKPQPCLRASPLPKSHGWGIIFDAQGKAALCAVESEDYAKHLANESITIVEAMRSKRKS